MKSTSYHYYLHSLALSLFLLFSAGVGAEEKESDKPHLGTWKLVSTKYGEAKEFSPRPAAMARLKLITSTHFTWVEVDNQTKMVVSSAGGSYTLDGESYIEKLEFVGDGMESYLGKAQKFTIKIEGDKLHQSGTLSDGFKIAEVWERVK